MNALRAGVSLAWSRARGPSLPLALGASLALALSLVRLTGAHGSLTDLDALLEGPVLGWLLPLLSYFVVERVVERSRLDDSVASLARHGADRRLAALGLLLVSAALCALAGALLAALTVSVAHARLDLASLRDAGQSTLIALVAGCVYATWFWAASALGRRGGGRSWALALDFLLGAGSSLWALPFPRSHLRNLLGGAPPAALPQPSAWLAFALLGALCALSALRRLAR